MRDSLDVVTPVSEPSPAVVVAPGGEGGDSVVIVEVVIVSAELGGGAGSFLGEREVDDGLCAGRGGTPSASVSLEIEPPG